MTLQEFFQQHPRAAMGFSGGVDSAFLLSEAVRCGADIRPYFVKTPFQPAFELEDALRLGAQLGITVTVLEYDILPAAGANPPDRCYHCKRALFGLLQRTAQADGYPVLLDGTNATDDAADRPGMRALTELQVLSPLRLCGLGKQEIRDLSRKAGLFTWNKPAYACLATRFPAGTQITAEALERVEQAEALLFREGFTDFRCRVFHGAARLQLRQEELPLALEKRETLLAALKPLFGTVLLDLEGR